MGATMLPVTACAALAVWLWGGATIASGVQLRAANVSTSRPLTALCLTGGARTFRSTGIPENLAKLTFYLNVSGFTSQTRPDVFAYLTLADDKRKNQPGYNFPQANQNREEMVRTLLKLKPVAYNLVQSAQDVTPVNLLQHCPHCLYCMNSGFFKEVGRVVRGMNQLVHMQSCLDLVKAKEDSMRAKYDVVVVARPDLYYNFLFDLQSVANSNLVLHQYDWLIAMPRPLMDNLIGPKARPVQCAPGERCCGTIQRPEDLFEYLLGVPIWANRQSCNCTTEESPYSGRDLCVAQIIRPQQQRTSTCQAPVTGYPIRTLTDHYADDEAADAAAAPAGSVPSADSVPKWYTLPARQEAAAEGPVVRWTSPALAAKATAWNRTVPNGTDTNTSLAIHADQEKDLIFTGETALATALCLSGGARTFTDDGVPKNIAKFLSYLHATGLYSASQPDIFAYLTLRDDKKKEQPGNNWPPRNQAREPVEGVLATLNPISYTLDPSAREVTQDNLEQYSGSWEPCMSTGFFSKKDRYIRGLNTLVHMQRCLALVEDAERHAGRKYDIVAIARPDLYYDFLGVNLELVHKEGVIMHQFDWFIAMPRPAMDSILGPKAHPLSCAPGQRCCGRIKRVEDILEYLLGAPMWSSQDSCNCTTEATNFKSQDMCIAEIVRTHGKRTGECRAPITGTPLRPLPDRSLVRT